MYHVIHIQLFMVASRRRISKLFLLLCARSADLPVRERSFLMKRLATGDQLVPLPEDTFQNPIPTALSDVAGSSLASLPSGDV